MRRDWTPYYPAEYSIRDGLHNPWVVIDPISKVTAYDVWLAMRGGSPHHSNSANRPVSDNELRAKIAEIRAAT